MRGGNPTHLQGRKIIQEFYPKANFLLTINFIRQSAVKNMIISPSIGKNALKNHRAFIVRPWVHSFSANSAKTNPCPSRLWRVVCLFTALSQLNRLAKNVNWLFARVTPV